MNVMLNALVISATVLGSGMALPQARQLARTRRTDGVSPTWVGVSMALNGWWLAYGLAASVWALVPVSVISFGLYASMAVLFVGTGGTASRRGLIIGAAGLGMVPLPFLVVGGWELAGLAVGLCYGLQLLPAVVAVLRTRALAGVSAATWLIAWTESMLWLVYGLGVSDLALIVAGTIGVAMSTLIVVRLGATGHRPLDVFTRATSAARWRKAQASLS
jgi:uncharacterized protein with PQ loop repeat